MINPEINVQVDDSMPLVELIENNNDPNISIKRSAHIGNMFGADLILSSLGMNMLLVDANYGERDKLYYPHLIVDEAEPIREIACPRTLSLANICSDGRPLNETCIRSLVDAFGNKMIFSDTQFIVLNIETVKKILEVVLQSNSGLFTRCNMSDGKPSQLTVQPKSVGEVLLFGNDPNEGAIIPNVVNILIDFVVEALTYQTNSITHISGPTMVKYLGGILPLMNYLYSRLIDSGLPLPEVLKVRLVPAAGVRFVIASAQTDILEEIIAMQAELSAVTKASAASKKALTLSGVAATKADFDLLTKPQKAVALELARLLDSVPQLFYVATPESNTPTYTSQYTALRNGASGKPGGGLYIPRMAVERPIAEVTAKFVELDKLRTRSK